MAKTVSSIQVRATPGLQYSLPLDIKTAVAKPLFAPYHPYLARNQEYKIAFAMRHKDWIGDDKDMPRYNEKNNVLFMWLSMDDDSYTFWGRFYVQGTILLSSAFVQEELRNTRWEITEAPRMVLFEKQMTH